MEPAVRGDEVPCCTCQTKQDDWQEFFIKIHEANVIVKNYKKALHCSIKKAGVWECLGYAILIIIQKAPPHRITVCDLL
jgi:hypothetical protein